MQKPLVQVIAFVSIAYVALLIGFAPAQASAAQKDQV